LIFDSWSTKFTSIGSVASMNVEVAVVRKAPLPELAVELFKRLAGQRVSDEPWPYGQWYSPGVDPRIREGFRWGKRR
jgi:hypothetical protein